MSYHKIKAPCYQSQGKKQKLTILQDQFLSSFHLLFFPFYLEGTTTLTPWIVFACFQSLYEWNSTIALKFSLLIHLVCSNNFVFFISVEWQISIWQFNQPFYWKRTIVLFLIIDYHKHLLQVLSFWSFNKYMSKCLVKRFSGSKRYIHKNLYWTQSSIHSNSVDSFFCTIFHFILDNGHFSCFYPFFWAVVSKCENRLQILCY